MKTSLRYTSTSWCQVVVGAAVKLIWWDQRKKKKVFLFHSKSINYSFSLLTFFLFVFARLRWQRGGVGAIRRHRLGTRVHTMAHTISHKRPVDWKNEGPVFFSCFLTWQSNSWVPLKGHAVSILEGRCNKKGEKRRGGEDTDIGTLLYWFQWKLQSWEVCKRSDGDPGEKRCSSNCFPLTVDAHVTKKTKTNQQPKTKNHFLSLAPPSVSCLPERSPSKHFSQFLETNSKSSVSTLGLLSASCRPRRGSAAQRRSCCSQVCMQSCSSPAGDKETSPIHHSQGCCSSCVQSPALLWSGMFLQSWKTPICWCTPVFYKESLLRDVSRHFKKKISET